MRRGTLVAAGLVLLATAAPALAEDRPSLDRLAGLGSFELQAGQYRPMIDSEFTLAPGTPGPWQSTFGTSSRWMFKLHGGKALFSGYGTLELGGGVGYTSFSAHGHFADGTVSLEKTGFKLVPLSIDLTYRLDLVWERFGVPLVPYGRVALIRDVWWVTGAGGKTSKSGATDGWAWGGGLALVLDFLDPELARELDRDSGIKHSMLVAEVAKDKVNDFGSSKSWDLSNDELSLTFGFLFTF
jgi:hypothetical protein